MRGARGIEFGVDLPAIPAIGLGTVYENSAAHHNSRPSQSTATAGGDGWGFGDWTRFVNVWKTTKKVEGDRAGSVHKRHQHDKESQKVHEELVGSVAAMSTSPSDEQIVASSSSTFSSPSPSTSSSTSTSPQRTAKEKEADDLLRASTEKLSAVFDWLIDIVPSTPSLVSSSSSSDKGKQKEVKTMKEMSRAAVELTAGGGASVSSSSSSTSPSSNHDSHSSSTNIQTLSSSTPAPPPSSPASPMKRRMDREDLGRRTNELGDRADLERFYVALARKMYDAGL